MRRAPPVVLPSVDLTAHETELRFEPGIGSSEVLRSQAEGELDLIVLSAGSPKEDAWFYVERGGLGYWRNIGVKESATHVEIDYVYDDSELRRAEKLIFYHMHTGHRHFGPLRAARLQYMRHGENAESVMWRVVRRGHSEWFAPPPSLSDFRTAASLEKIAAMLRLPAVASKVVTPLGIYTYGSSPALRRVLLATDQREAEALWHRLRKGDQTQKARLSRLREAGFLIEFQPAPGNPWALLRQAFRASRPSRP